MNMFKKNGGFTLVELIVVIAILAILAAVAIPAYSGYITKAQEANDYTMLDSVKTAVVFAVMDKNASATVKSITVGTDAKAVAVVTSDATITTVDISAYVDGDTISYKSGATGATLNLEATTAKWVLTK